jgi:type VI secretion system protein ImpA
MGGNAVFERLLRPLSAAGPCGRSLDYTPLLTAFDAYRLFGQPTEIGTRPTNKPNDPAQPPPWEEVIDKSLAALELSKDLRLLAYLAAGLVRREGVIAFCEVLQVAAAWLENWFDAVYPLAEADLFRRTSALNYFVDRLAIVDALRRAPLATQQPTGAVSLRLLELAKGVLPVGKADPPPPQEAELQAVFAATPFQELEGLLSAVTAAVDALKRIDASMTAAGGIEAIADFDGRDDKERSVSLRHQLRRIQEVVRVALQSHPQAAVQAVTDPAADAAPPEAPPVAIVGLVRSRQDAIRALDAVVTYFVQAEPTSPVPIFIERAKRLISKSFFAALEDIVPDALNAAKVAGGVREERK